MPRELIATNPLYQPAGAVLPPGDWPEGSTVMEPSGQTLSLSIGWAKDGRWTQVYLIPSSWQSTSDWHIISVEPDEIDHLIHTLKRAKRQAFRS